MSTACLEPHDDGNDGNDGNNGDNGGRGGQGGGRGGGGGDDGGNFSQSNEQNTVVQDSICANVEQAASNQYNAGDQAAGSDSDDTIGDLNAAGSASNIANTFGLTTAQVNACLNQVNASASGSASVATSATPSATVAAGGGGGGGGGSAGGGGEGSASATASASAAAGTLPSTGGGFTSAL